MKKVLLILLALNLVLAAAIIVRNPWTTRAIPGQHAPLNVERMSLRGQAASGPAAAAPQRDAYCVEWRGLTLPEFARAREQLKGLVSQRVMSFGEIPLNTRYWVIFPPLPSPDAARFKLSEFAAAGLRDAAVVDDGIWQNAISLGLYATLETARQRVREAEGMSILGTRIEQQPVLGTDFYFVIRSEDGEALKNLNELKAGYPNSQLSRVACQAS